MGKSLSKDKVDGIVSDTSPTGTSLESSSCPTGYVVTEVQDGEIISAKLELASAVRATTNGGGYRINAPVEELISPLQCDIMYETPTRVHFKIFDPRRQRFEVRYQDLRTDFPVFKKKAAIVQYAADVSEKPFAITVTRRTSGSILFDTRGSGIHFEDHKLQLSTTLPTKYIYGLGERRKHFLIDANIEHTFAFWCSGGGEQNTQENANLYGVHPFYMGLEDDGSAFGVFLLNSCPMEVKVRPGTPPTLTYTVGGGILDVYVFVGPSPLAVVQQYQEVVGQPCLPPYWALGFHLSRWGYGSAAHLGQVIQRNRATGIPYDGQWTDIDMMDKGQACMVKDSLLPKIVEDLHNNGQKYVLVVDPVVGINQSDPAYIEGIDSGMFMYTHDRARPLVGKAWRGDCLFTDFTHPSINEYCLKQARQLYSIVPFDGIWLDRNEPANLVSGCREDCAVAKQYHPFDSPKFVPDKLAGRNLFNKTVCPSANQHGGEHFYTHNLCGHFQLKVMQSVMNELTGKRSLIVSRSTFAGSGKYGGHWTGDNKSSFVDLRYSISELLDFNIFGIPLVGANIGGFSKECSEELMIRWMQVGAFYPLMRNHNTHPDFSSTEQDPAAYGESAQESMRDITTLRYSLLPYLYTLLYENHVVGSPVIRPLFMEFPRDRLTYGIDEQFMWGDSLLVSPCVHQGEEQVEAYFPHELWYNYFTGARLAKMGTSMTLYTPISQVNVHIRGGSIVATQMPAVNTVLSRRNPFRLKVALSSKHTAVGKLYWDDGESLDSIGDGTHNIVRFEAKENHLTSVIEHSGYYSKMTLSVVHIFGVYVAPENVEANGRPAMFYYDESAKVLRIENLQLSLQTTLSIKWE